MINTDFKLVHLDITLREIIIVDDLDDILYDGFNDDPDDILDDDINGTEFTKHCHRVWDALLSFS